jgi:phi13 family phage major tail protein
MTINSNEYRSAVGLKDLYIAEVTQDDADGYVAGTPEYFAPAMEASAVPAVNSKTQYADDGPFDVMSSEGETKITLSVTGLPVEILAKITGRVFDVSIGRMYDNGGTPPYFALGFRGMRANGEYRYFWFLKGSFQMPDDERTTKGDSPDPKPAKIIFTALKTIYQWNLDGTITDGVKRIVGDTDTTDFSETGWFTSVQVPTYSAPSALTCTADPADNATNVNVTKTITLTFNNALRTYGGVALLKVSDDSVVPSAISINNAKKIITIDPNSNLTASDEFYIVVAGVIDVFGQTLATVVYSFGTAS